MGLAFSNCTIDESVISPSSTVPKPTTETTTSTGTVSPTSSSLYHPSEEETLIHQNPPTSPPRTPSSPSRRRRRGGTVTSSFSPRRAFLILLQSMNMTTRSGYFRNYTKSKGLLYGAAITYVVSCSLISLFEPLLVNCKEEAVLSDFENPGYAFAQECHHKRTKWLLFLTPEECTFGRRIVLATILGALIGYERRQADRPAGIRTMSLVSLGSCLFSICGTFAFIDGPMGWDASRISAAIPSGVGFLGAGIIWKQTDKETNSQSVHGLTTAASLWLSAAVGIACAGELYFAASFAIAVMMILLRFGPRIIVGDEHGFSSERDHDLRSEDFSIPAEVSGYKYSSIDLESNRPGTSPPSSPRKVMKKGLNNPSIRE